MTTAIAVILSGCGFLDGSEIHESVLTLLAIDKFDAKAKIYAPDIPQTKVVNHFTKSDMQESRNVLVESARIARGHIEPLSALDITQVDAVIFPGGFGAALNLSSVGIDGADGKVLPEVQSIIKECLVAKKPIGVICISPAMLIAAVKGEISPVVTIGDDPEGLISALGGIHQLCPTEGAVRDEEHKIISCSAYMRDDRLVKIAQGIEQVVSGVIEWARVS